MIVTEYMDNGALDTYLKVNRFTDPVEGGGAKTG